MRHLLVSLLSSTFILLTVAVQAAELNVHLIVSEGNAFYQQFTAAFNQALAAHKIHVTTSESLAGVDSDADLIVTAGTKAMELAVTQTSIPLLAVMIPKLGYEDILAQTVLQKTTRKISAIYLDQPWGRQLNFLQATLPERRKIGLLHSPDTRIDLARLRQDIAKRGGALVTQPVQAAEQIFPSLESVLNNSDVLLAIPDSSIFSNSNIRNILLASYQHRVPLIGLSQSYVNAGALSALFSTPEQLAQQASSTVIVFAQTGQLPDVQYPADFTVAVNQQVAQSLGIKLPSQKAIHDYVNAAEKRR